VLTDEQRSDFERDGIIKLPRAFDAADAARMRDVVWGELRAKYDIQRDDPTTWHRHDPTKLKNTKRHRAFDAILSPTVTGALDDVFGAGGWQRPKNLGNVLVTMPGVGVGFRPEVGPWRVPHKIWHSDFEYRTAGAQPFAVKVWALFDDVAPGGGGTPQLAGSHHLSARFVADLPSESLDYRKVRDGILRSHPWLRALGSATDDDPERNHRLMVEGAVIDGVPIRVVECTGEAGDVYVTHAWVMHSIAANAGERPRLMRSAAVFRGPAAVP
jgi:hypothetical protein